MRRDTFYLLAVRPSSRASVEPRLSAGLFPGSRTLGTLTFPLKPTFNLFLRVTHIRQNLTKNRTRHKTSCTQTTGGNSPVVLFLATSNWDLRPIEQTAKSQAFRGTGKQDIENPGLICFLWGGPYRNKPQLPVWGPFLRVERISPVRPWFSN